jgi:imidazole glycerol-phosphate synthase subunit HisF
MVDRLRVIERRDVDELIILDVSSLAPRFDEVSRLCENLFCPVTIGGGVRNVQDIARLLRSGADKVAINRMAFERPEFVREAAERFGSQAIVVSIDVMDTNAAESGRHGRRFYSKSNAAHFAADFQHRGAGEILLTSVDRDGTLSGYDLDLIKEIAGAVSIPVIAAGGCGSYEHMEQAIAAGAHAVASGAMFQFCEATPKGAARHLKAQGINTRI